MFRKLAVTTASVAVLAGGAVVTVPAHAAPTTHTVTVTQVAGDPRCNILCRKMPFLNWICPQKPRPCPRG